MVYEKSRNYSCKDAELPVICNFVAFSLKRDLADFTAFSPKFNPEYASAFEGSTAAVSEVIEPKSETLDMKLITKRLYANMDSLKIPMNRIEGYIKLAKLPISSKDFGLSALRKSVNKSDAEGIVKELNLVILNCNKYKDLLAAQGLSDDLLATLVSTSTSIAADNQKQYEIMSTRKNIVQNNLDLFNALYLQLTEILGIGKILYKGIDAIKYEEYTFAKLKSKVRIIAKAANAPEI